jgi:hypothetical protein
MKRVSVYCCLSLALLTFFLLPTHPMVAQALSNPGLEGDYNTVSEYSGIQGEVAPGWMDNTCWDSKASVHYAKETDAPHDGATAQRIEIIHGRVQFVQPLTFVTGQRYTIHIWLRAAQPLSVELLLRQADAPYTTYTSRQVALSTTWTRYTLAGAGEPVPGFFMVIATTPGLFWLDDVELNSTSFVTTLPDAAIPRSFFGMHIHNTTTPWPAVERRIGAIRLWDASGLPRGAQWAEINTSRGLYAWAALDAHLARALSNNVDLVFNLGRTPQWASARPQLIGMSAFAASWMAAPTPWPASNKSK